MESTDTPPRRVTRDSAAGRERAEPVEITPDELTSILQEASRLQSSAGDRRLTTIEEAYEAARELGIAEEHVAAAAETLRRRKARQLRARAATERRKRSFLRFLGITVAIVVALVFLRGINPARTVLFVMSIPLLILGFQWINAELKARSPHDSPQKSSPGECRVCGERAWGQRATFCDAHRPRG